MISSFLDELVLLCYRRIIDKHLKSLAPRHFDTKFLKLDAEVRSHVVLSLLYPKLETFL